MTKIESWIIGEVVNGRQATVSLALLESGYPPEVPVLRAIDHWAKHICRQVGCTHTIHVPSDVITFYPVSKL